MRIVLLLVVVAIIGFTMKQWLNRPPSTPTVVQEARGSVPTTPTVPTRPQDLKKFEQDMNRFMRDAAKQSTREAP
ncbi:MAG: hypothetical protein IPK63_20560 [Candidatus Competibacteraceae bacterium]|nr:hypothetical protein [Candidatus Competibacteraceae bacterium]